MALRLRKVESLAKELNKDSDDVINMLLNKGIKTVDGYYDQALFDATMKEPALKAQQRTEWGLSPRLGIGAVKSIMDPLGIRITVHDCKGAQYLMCKKGNVHQYVKWQYANSAGKKVRACNFQVRGFMVDAKFEHYIFTCFEGPFAWALSRKHMIAAWDTIISGGEVTGFQIPADHRESETGSLLVRLSLDNSKFEFKAAKQLGL